MKNYYQGIKGKPYHLSIGAVAVNNKQEICTHYFKELAVQGTSISIKDFYILMRETMEMGETIEQALHRGLMEEFGITGDIVTYLGSIRDDYFDPGKECKIEKTTLYFLVKTKTFNPDVRKKDDPESSSEIEWKTPEFLIEKMKEQAVRLKLGTLDESSILEKVKVFGTV